MRHGREGKSTQGALPNQFLVSRETLGKGVGHKPQGGNRTGVFGDIYTPTPVSHC